MATEVFVDVTYRGLEVGRRLKLREVGPRTAYLEHGTPMPVGAEIVLASDEGLSVPVVVVRVHEQVAGAEMPPGMRVRAVELKGEAGLWWEGMVSRAADPEIPEVEVAVVAEATPGRDGPRDMPGSRDTTVMSAVDIQALGLDMGEAPGATDLAEPAAESGAAIEADDLAEPDDGGGNGNRRRGSPSSRTLVMSAAEIEQVTGESGQEPDADDELTPVGDSDGDGDQASGANGNGTPHPPHEPAGKATRRRRRRR